MASSKCIHLIGVLLIVATIFVLAESKTAKSKPASSYFTICRRSDPKINECIAKNINDLRPKLIKGIPELRLVPLDPMVIPSMTITEGTGNFRLTQVLNNLTIHGLGKFEIQEIDFKMDDNTANITIDMNVGSSQMTSYYDMDGRILILPIRGKGDCVLNLNGLRTIGRVVGKIVKKDGEDHLLIDELKWEIKVAGFTAQFNNLFNGDKLLGDATNSFINENWEDAFKTYKHLPEEAFGVFFKELINQVFKKFPLNELILE